MKAKATQVIQATELVPVIGTDLTKAASLVKVAKSKASSSKRSTKGRVIVQNGVDFSALGKESAGMILGIDAEYKAALRELKLNAQQSRIVVYIMVAEQISTPEQILTVCEAYGSALEAGGMAGYKTRKSELKVFLSAWLVDNKKTLAICDAENEADALSMLRELRDSVKPKQGKGNKTKENGRNRKPNDASMTKVMKYIGNMDVEQLTMVYKAGMSRAKVLRAAGEKFEAFK